jgi:hypothetical protein
VVGDKDGLPAGYEQQVCDHLVIAMSLFIFNISPLFHFWHGKPDIKIVVLVSVTVSSVRIPKLVAIAVRMKLFIQESIEASKFA